MEHSDWVYKGEGNMNIVFNFLGEQGSKYSGCILRLKKNSKASEVDTCTLRDEWNYMQNMITPLIGSKFIPSWTFENVDKEFLLVLNESATSFRLQSRQVKSIDYTQTEAAFSRDVSVLNNNTFNGVVFREKDFISSSEFNGRSVCFELKPKISNPVYSNKQNIRKCRFCTQQILKKRKSLYCPWQLFSGRKSDLSNALQKLWKCPNNNLKLFVDGTSVSDLSFLEENKNAWLGIVADILEKEQVLQKLYQVQAKFGASNEFDVDQIAELWEQADQSLSICQVQYADVEIAAKRRIEIAASGSAKEKALVVFAYLVSRTLYDCSIMIAFQLEDLDCKYKAKYSISVIDLDPKTPQRLLRFREIESELIQCQTISSFCKYSFSNFS